MGFSDEQIRDMLELKEDLTEKIIKYIEQIEKLEKNFYFPRKNRKRRITSSF